MITFLVKKGTSMYNNGILIQDINEGTGFVHKFNYSGINAFWQFPLTWINDEECRLLTKEQQSKEIEPLKYVAREFISDYDLYVRYIKKCRSLGINFRILFVQSDYEKEIWYDGLPKMNFLGFEYCPIPIDEQIITDLDWYEPFRKYSKQLNDKGLFKSYEDAKTFEEHYKKEVLAEKVGDGEANNYIIKLYEVIP